MEGMTAQLEKILDESVETIEENTDKLCREAADSSVKRLKATSPHRRGDYAAGWTYQPTNRGGLKGYTVYNATNYQLTHLLEHGHAKVNGGRVRARKHIEPVEISEMEKLVAKLQTVTG